MPRVEQKKGADPRRPVRGQARANHHSGQTRQERRQKRAGPSRRAGPRAGGHRRSDLAPAADQRDGGRGREQRLLRPQDQRAAISEAAIAHGEGVNGRQGHRAPVKRRPLSQESLAEKADPHPVYISQVERGEKAVSVDARLNGPGGVAADSAGNVYVADSSNHAVRRIAVSASAHH